MDGKSEAQEAQVRKFLVPRVPYDGGGVLRPQFLETCPAWPGPLLLPLQFGCFTVAAEMMGWGPCGLPA